MKIRTGTLLTVLIASLSLLAVACGKKDEKGGGGDDMKAMTEQFVKLVDEACACKDKACFDAKQKEITELGKKGAEAAKKADQKEPPPEVAAAGKKLGECAVKIMSGGAAPTPPAAGDGDGDEAGDGDGDEAGDGDGDEAGDGDGEGEEKKDE